MTETPERPDETRAAMSSHATGPLTPAEMAALAAEMEAVLIESESQFSHPDWRYVDGLRALAGQEAPPLAEIRRQRDAWRDYAAALASS